MSFALLRAPLRKVAFSGTTPVLRAQFRTSFRKFSTSTPPAPKKSNIGLFLGFAAAVGAGSAYYYYSASGQEAGTAIKSGVQATKAKVKFVPTQEDYQKVGARVLHIFKCS